MARARTPGMPPSLAERGHHHHGQHHDRADRQVDARREDDERLPHREGRDDRGLLEEDAHRVGGEERRRRDEEGEEGDEEQEQRAQPWPAVQLVLHPLQGRLLPPSELGGSRGLGGGGGHGSVAPADLGALVRGDAVHALGGLVGHQRDAGVVEVEARVEVFGFSPPRAILAIASMPMRGHLQRVLLRGGADDAVLDAGDAGAAAVDRTTMVAVLPAAFSAALAPTAVGSLIV